VDQTVFQAISSQQSLPYEADEPGRTVEGGQVVDLSNQHFHQAECNPYALGIFIVSLKLIEQEPWNMAGMTVGI
jgi:hypothetical protein